MDEDKLARYDCIFNPEQKMNITNVSLNYDFNFNTPYEMTISPLASFTKDKLINQTGNIISSKDIIILYGNLTQNNDYFFVKGNLNKNFEIDNRFNLTVYLNNVPKNISCEIQNNNYNDFEIKCEKDDSQNFNINNTISRMETTLLLLSINSEENDLVEGKKVEYNKLYNKKGNKNLSPGVIVAIVLSVIVVCVVVGLLVIFRNRIFKKIGSKEASESTVEGLNINY
jgi:hypothetical protein